VPDARDIFQRIEHVAAVVERDCGDPSHGASVRQLPLLKRMVIPPCALKVLKLSSWQNADLRPNGIELLIHWHSVSLAAV